MHIDISIRHHDIVPDSMVQQLGPAVDPALVRGQVVNEPELGSGKFNRLASTDHLVPRGVDHQVANRDPVG